MTVKETLQKTLKFFGPNGERWCSFGPVHNDQRCIIMAISTVAEEQYTTITDTVEELSKVVPNYRGRLSSYNDDPNTTFADVKTLFEKAIAAQ